MCFQHLAVKRRKDWEAVFLLAEARNRGIVAAVSPECSSGAVEVNRYAAAAEIDVIVVDDVSTDSTADSTDTEELWEATDSRNVMLETRETATTAWLFCSAKPVFETTTE